jgi:hypothetical protein
VSAGINILGIMKRTQFTNSARQRALAVLARMRSRGESLSEAARHERTTARTVLRILPKQFKRRGSGSYAASRGDRLQREISVLSFDGYVPVVARSSKQAQLASAHLIALNRFLRTGDERWLKPFIRKRVGGVELLTDTDRIQSLGDADLVNLDGLYRNNPGGGREK